MASQRRLQAVRIQSDLREVTCEENSRGLKIAVVTVISAYEYRNIKKYSELNKLLLYHQV